MESEYLPPANQYGLHDRSTPLKAGSPAQHQRTYQACIPCRRRKVRCDLGSVDNPSDPPCVRCRRESKECYFSATRRKKKGVGNEVQDEHFAEAEPESYEIKSSRKRLRASNGGDHDEYEDEDEEEPRTPGGSLGRAKPLRRPPPQKPIQYGEEDHKVSDQTTAMLQRTEVHGGHDALKVLNDAAQYLVKHGRQGSKDSTTLRPDLAAGLSPGSMPPSSSPVVGRPGQSSYGSDGRIHLVDGLVSTPRNDSKANPANESIDRVHYATALKAWSRFRFVRASWFTAKEAIDYVQYFYRYLSPLTPISLPDYRPYESHEKLLTLEPMLAVTILLIASRHMKLEGPGSVSRPYAIHQKLSAYLSGMINRVMWGQEQFGVEFGSSGMNAEPGCDINPITRKGLRTLGTVEALVLLTEWHPRAMHFPPDEADDELMVPEERTVTPDATDVSDISKGIGGQRMDAWLEPCWRSDRMCWMLLGMATSLAYEIGVFDAGESARHMRNFDEQRYTPKDLHVYDERRDSIKNILLIYVTQTSGRLGLTSMLPPDHSRPENSDLLKLSVQELGGTQEIILHFWLRIAAIVREGNWRIFRNKEYTRQLITSGNYRHELDKFKPVLQSWREDFERCTAIPKYMRLILQIEYEYNRVYLNALALQALAERCANGPPVVLTDQPIKLAKSAINGNAIGPDAPITPQTLSKWLGGDRHYMTEIADAARNVLKIVVEGLYPGQYLKHAPVRTYFRIICVAIVLLKSFALGASESDVADSLALMDRTVEALRNCIVDDVHVASRFADLVDTLIQNLKPRLVRISAHGRSRRVSHHSSEGSQHVPVPKIEPRLSAYRQQQYEQRQQQQQLQQQQVPTNTMPNVQQANYYPMQNTSNMHNMSSGPMQNDPMFGVSNDTYDLTENENNYSVMPPPSFPFNSPNQNMNPEGNYEPYMSANNDFGGVSNSSQDWLALPLDPMINMSGAVVHQTMYGPEMAGQDMLELLLGNNNPSAY